MLLNFVKQRQAEKMENRINQVDLFSVRRMEHLIKIAEYSTG
jgi:hypothetical protein